MDNKKQECTELLASYKRVYDEYQDAQKEHKAKLREVQQEREREINDLKSRPAASASKSKSNQETSSLSRSSQLRLREQQRKLFDESQYVEWHGKPHNCRNNTSQARCTTMATEAHSKCKCQSLFANRPHLNAPCNPDAGLLSPPVSYEWCLAKGYLDNHDLDASMCIRHSNLRVQDQDVPPCPSGESSQSASASSSSTQSNGASAAAAAPAGETTQSNAGESKRSRGIAAAPVPPTLKLPTNTCTPCFEAFRQLELDFSYENLARASQCIERIGETPKAPISSPVPTSSASSLGAPPMSAATPSLEPAPPTPVENTRTAGAVRAPATTSLSSRRVIAYILLAVLVLFGVLLTCAVVRDVRLHRDHPQCFGTTTQHIPDLAPGYVDGVGDLSDLDPRIQRYSPTEAFWHGAPFVYNMRLPNQETI